MSDRLTVALVCLGLYRDLARTVAGSLRTRKFIGLAALMTTGDQLDNEISAGLEVQNGVLHGGGDM